MPTVYDIISDYHSQWLEQEKRQLLTIEQAAADLVTAAKTHPARKPLAELTFTTSSSGGVSKSVPPSGPRAFMRNLPKMGSAAWAPVRPWLRLSSKPTQTPMARSGV